MGANIFNTVKGIKPNRNVFDLTHDVKTSFNMGELIPICQVEVLPGDKFTISTQALTKFAPLISPMMHRLDLFVHYFFVPYRLLWKNWQFYITGRNDPSTGLPPVFPTTTVAQSGANFQVASGQLADYLGLPFTAGTTGTEVVSLLPFAAYQKIYDDYYRDQNLITAIFPENTLSPIVDGPNTGPQITSWGCTVKRIRAWEHDYFTASLPFAQKGNAVAIPLGNVVVGSSVVGGSGIIRDNQVGLLPLSNQNLTASNVNAVAGQFVGSTQAAGHAAIYDPNGTLTVAPTLINDLRRAYAIQRWLEANARGGSRYIESMLMHFGVQSSDARLQRPEYICGLKSPIIIGEVLNTGGDQATLPQGNMAGKAVGAAAGKAGSFYAEEHGLLMGIASILPKTAYSQGIAKQWLKTLNQYDFAWPELANIGEQTVVNSEIYAYQAAGANANTFGYVPRYAEYKYEPNRVSGDFRGTLDYWHLARNFGSAPALNQTFVECVPRTDIYAVTDPATQHIYCNVLNQIKVSRLLPKYGTPHP